GVRDAPRRARRRERRVSLARRSVRASAESAEAGNRPTRRPVLGVSRRQTLARARRLFPPKTERARKRAPFQGPLAGRRRERRGHRSVGGSRKPGCKQRGRSNLLYA